MSKDEIISHLKGELATVLELAESLPDTTPAAKSTMLYRARDLRAEIAALERESLPSYGFVAFFGAPVDSTRSIFAAFAGRSLAAFSNAFKKMAQSASSSVAGKLKGYVEPLRIIGTRAGSFGFEFEVPASDDTGSMFLTPDMVSRGREESALEALIDIIKTASTGSKEDVDKIKRTVHPSAVQAVAKFADVVSKGDAGFSLTYGDASVRLEDASDASHVSEVLSEDSSTEVIELRGKFLGVLPEKREFEFRPDGDMTARGYMSEAFGDLSKTTWKGRRALVTVEITTTSKRKKLLIIDLVDLPIEDPDEDEGGDSGAEGAGSA